MARSTAAALLLALASVIGSGCAKRPATDEAQEAVKRFFAALPDKDCGVLQGMLVDDCAAVVDGVQQHGLRLLEVLGAEVDGRNPEAVMVRVRMERDGQRREVTLRVEHRPEGWKLKL